MKTNKKGFTLIELLVVIAIIGILSSIVLASLGSARTNANDAKVKSQLFSIRDAAEIYYTTNFNYGATTNPTAFPPNGCTSGMFTDTQSNLANLSISANYPTGENTLVCNSSGTAYAVSDKISGASNYWCVDSNGQSKPESSNLSSGVVQCP